jgi:TolB protein
MLVLGISLLAVTGLVSLARRHDPQPTWIVFSSNRTGDDEIYRMRPDGSLLQRLTYSPNADWPSDISSEGQHILFVSFRDGERELYQMRLDGSHVERLTQHDGVDEWGAYDPDSQKIVYISSDNLSTYLQLLDLTERQPYRLGTIQEVGMPAWSPQGDRVVFAGWVEGYFMLFTMPISTNPLAWGLAPAESLTTAYYQQLNPSWSPTGEWIAYYANANGNWDVYLIRPDGTGQRRLTTSSDFDGLPRWSPDGERLVFISRRDGNQELYTMHRSGADQTRLTDHPNDDTLPIWSPALQRPWRRPWQLVALGGLCVVLGALPVRRFSGR